LYKTLTTALTGKEMQSPFGGWRHHLARWEACHWILSRLRLLTNPVPLPPPQAGAVRRSRIGGERSEPVSRMLIMPYDTESKSRNVLASPLGEEGHEVAKGCTRVRMIMTFDVDVTGKAAL
jgi:hypothetical protein